MQKAMAETDRRRAIQIEYNKKHGITPQTIKKSLPQGLLEVYESVHGAKAGPSMDKFIKYPDKIIDEIEKLKKKMKTASQSLEFEEAARYRDEIRRLQLMQLEVTEADDRPIQ
jgi:excinuclease ABC subunit B